jgi:hypothetical protein
MDNTALILATVESQIISLESDLKNFHEMERLQGETGFASDILPTRTV